jgi:predicted CXXCH cytochrome family protein
VTVNFTVAQPLPDGGSVPVPALSSGSPKLTVAKLEPAGVGEASNHWVPYITRKVTVPDAGYPMPAGFTALQAYRENNGTLTSGANGSFTYTSAVKLTAAAWATDGGLVGYEPNLTHRVAIMMGGATGPTGSAYLDFVPAGGTVTETRDIVETASCRECHGPQFAAHGGDRTEAGVCVTCHNPTSQDAYTGNVVDFRIMVHKIHAGSELESVAGPDGIVWDDPTTPQDESADNKPYFIGPNVQDWWKITFPAVLANCTKCHTGTQANVDQWKTKPGIAACTSCHDTLDLVSGSNHPGGALGNDSTCSGCHTSGGTANTVLHPIADSHDWTANDPRLQPEFFIDYAMSPPANGSYYVKGEAPSVKVSLRDAVTGLALDNSAPMPDPVPEGCPADGGACPPRDGLFTGYSFFVHGPRANNMPVLTTRARAPVLASSVGPFDLSADGGTFVVKLDNGSTIERSISGADTFYPGLVTVPVKAGTFANIGAATAAEVVAWLNANPGFAVRAVAYLDERTGRPAVRSRNLGTLYGIQLQPSTVTTAVFNNNQNLQIPGGFTPTNTLTLLADAGINDFKATYAPDGITYQLDPVDDLPPGTYTVGVEVADRGRIDAKNFKLPSVNFLNFQVGTATVEKPIAANCNICHQNAAGQGMLFDPSRHNKILRFNGTDQCTSCHDYQPGAATGAAWNGALPISKRVHAVHNGANLTYPNTTVGHADDDAPGRNWDITFPRDIRECEACHANGTTSGTWATNPARLPCSGCHDSDAATAHIRLMTYDPTPNDAWSGDEQESCKVCHQ